MTTFFVIAFLRCGAAQCVVFYPMPYHHYQHIANCERDAATFRGTVPADAVVNCVSVQEQKESRR